MDKYRIEIPEFCLVAMIGGTSSGKSSFALKHFKPTEVLSSDFFRGMVCDDENSQSVSGDAFDLLYYAANKRLNNMKLWHCVSKGRNATEAGKKNAVVYINNVHEFKKITLSRLKFLFFEGYLILTYLA